MLFLAVTFGFFVENQRERYSERGQELEYAKSMIDDLKEDKRLFEAELQNKNLIVLTFDSLIYLLNKKERNEAELRKVYYLARMVPRMTALTPLINNRTYEQMKSSGNLRLIQDKKIADFISKYYIQDKQLAVKTDQIVLRHQKMIELESKVFSGFIFQQMTDMGNLNFSQPAGIPKLITEDEEVLNELVGSLHFMVSISVYTTNFVVGLNKETKQLITVLEKEYLQD